RLYPHTGRAQVVGVTGAPGSGKSTLARALALVARARGGTVGIVAVDPSSPFSGGAILGDRIRMTDLALDPGIFIRSMATRGAPGDASPAPEGGGHVHATGPGGVGGARGGDRGDRRRVPRPHGPSQDERRARAPPPTDGHRARVEDRARPGRRNGARRRGPRR